MLNYVCFFLAALFEIAGCYGFWMWLRQGKSAWWALPAILSLVLFALLLTKVEAAYAGRAYAAYGGIYIVTSIAWLAVVERIRPLGSDWLGVGLCVIGATIILLGPRFTPS
ncbi:YnfA family protein [Pseudomonas sp. TWR1-1-3]|uniref:YnfA family protein n=1 Tax=Pseudomonas sp. TWR1-1-3 TaxID=2804624 RepID=UPI003CF646F6